MGRVVETLAEVERIVHATLRPQPVLVLVDVLDGGWWVYIRVKPRDRLGGIPCRPATTVEERVRRALPKGIGVKVDYDPWHVPKTPEHIGFEVGRA